MAKDSKKERKSSRKSHHRHSSSSRKRKKHKSEYIKLDDDESASSEPETYSGEENFSDSNESFSSSSSISYKRKSSSRKDHRKGRSIKSSRSKNKKRSSRDRKDRKHSKKRSKHEQKRSKPESQRSNIPPQSRDILHTLLQVLTPYPDLSSQIIHMLRQMSGSGTSFDLGQMKDPNAARLLEHFFETLRPYGVQRQSSEASVWRWKIDSSSGINQKWDDWFLIKIVASLMDQAGFTIEAISKFETMKAKKMKEQKFNDVNERENTENIGEELRQDSSIEEKPNVSEQPSSANTALNEIQDFTNLLLTNFSEPTTSSTSTGEMVGKSSPPLAKDLIQLCQLLATGETLSLENIPNVELRMGLQILFTRSGLDYYEMDPDSEDEDENENSPGNANEKEKPEPCMGFGLPDTSTDNKSDLEKNVKIEKTQTNIKAIIQSCESFHHKTMQRNKITKLKPNMKGPSLPDPDYDPNAKSVENHHRDDDSSSSDDDGPAPAGSAMAKRRGQIGPRIPSKIVKVMAAQRSKDLFNAKEGIEASNDSAPSSSREEWMMNPGEHDFLQGIVRTGDILKNRKFKNEKQRGQSLSQGGDGTAADQPPAISARLQKQMDDVIKAHAEARGPSLIDQHREKVEEEKKAKKGENDWNWSRDDLDAGRRVDKKALGQILGGAAKGLNDKFQGTASRGFM